LVSSMYEHGTAEARAWPVASSMYVGIADDHLGRRRPVRKWWRPVAGEAGEAELRRGCGDRGLRRRPSGWAGMADGRGRPARWGGESGLGERES
jgi:hypothetical protein